MSHDFITWKCLGMREVLKNDDGCHGCRLTLPSDYMQPDGCFYTHNNERMKWKIIVKEERW